MNELIQYETDHGEVQLSHEIVRKYLVSGGAQVTDQEIVMFINLCKFQQLNPFLREAYLIKYSASEPATMVTGKDTFTKRAQKNKMFRGFKAGVITEKAGKINYRDGSMVIKGETLVGGWAEIYVEGWTVPLRNEVSFDEYCAKNAKGEPNRQWRRMPGTMIRKVALVQALREAFPQDFQGMYDSAEMGVEGLPEKNVTPDQEPEPEKPEAEPEPENPKDAFRKRLREVAALYLNPAFTGADRKDAKEKLAAINDAMDSEALEAFAVATQARIDGINGKPEEKPAEPAPETTDEPAEKELDIF
jgi:phage recombination protein Bet